MLRLFKAPLKARLFPLIWPQPNDNCIELGRSFAGTSYPTLAIQATTAIANLAMAWDHLTQVLASARVEGISADLKNRILAHVAQGDACLIGTQILRLQREQVEWRKASGARAATQVALTTVLHALWETRLRDYRADMARAKEAALSGSFDGYGPMGFVAKRWLSQISGREICQEDDLLEEGFSELGAASLYFTYKVRQLIRAAQP
jgi:hypothetical protein